MFLLLKRHQLTFLTASPTQFHLRTYLLFHYLAIGNRTRLRHFVSFHTLLAIAGLTYRRRFALFASLICHTILVGFACFPCHLFASGKLCSISKITTQLNRYCATSNDNKCPPQRTFM